MYIGVLFIPKVATKPPPPLKWYNTSWKDALIHYSTPGIIVAFFMNCIVQFVVCAHSWSEMFVLLLTRVTLFNADVLYMGLLMPKY